MKIITGNLKREEIVGYSGHMHWYERNQEDNEILLLINEKEDNENGEIVNMINHKENFGRISIDVPHYGIRFYEENKSSTPRAFIRQCTGRLFNEYEVDSWGADEKGLYIKFK
jgi:hypothetical protein